MAGPDSGTDSDIDFGNGKDLIDLTLLPGGTDFENLTIVSQDGKAVVDPSAARLGAPPSWRTSTPRTLDTEDSMSYEPLADPALRGC